MEDAEHQIEITSSKFENIFTHTVGSMNPVDLSLTTNKENELSKAIDLYEEKMRLLHELENNTPVPQPYSYSQKVLDDLNISSDLPADTTKALYKFYNNEIKRVNDKIDIINERCKSEEKFIEIIPQLSLVVESGANYLMKCKEALLRLGPSTFTMFSNDDIKYELQRKFYQRSQSAFINEMIDIIDMFPLTRRRSIYQTFVDKVAELFSNDRNSKNVTTYLGKEEDLDRKIHTLAKLFKIDGNIEENDGQSFTYKCDSLFNNVIHNLTVNEVPRRAIEVPVPPIKLKRHELIHNSIIASIPEDHKTNVIFNNILKRKEYELLSDFKERSSFYSTFVGNGVLKTRIDIPQFKVYTMLELRCIHIKFLWEMLVHYINYFQYVRYTVANPGNTFKVRQSKVFKEFIEVYDEKGAFIFDSTDKICKSIISKLSRICGFFISKGEKANQNQIDRELVIERIFELEIELCSVKYAAITPLMEILEHCKSETIINQIHSIINISPIIDTTSVYSFESPYLILIDVLKVQAKITRQLVNTQIIHLRHTSALSPSDIPIFDKPHFIPCKIERKYQSGSVSITPFEVYETLADVGKVFTSVDNIIPQLLEEGNIKVDKFYTVMMYAVWNEVNKRMSNVYTEGVFPYDIMKANNLLKYSDSVNSLFSSRFLNNFEPLEKIISTMNEGRQMKAMMSARRLYNFTWKLQREIKKTENLQYSYIHQCKEVGVTDNHTQLSPFSNTVGNQTTMPVDVIDFSLNEFNPIGIDFNNITYLKDVLFTANFYTIVQIIRAQKHQNMFLETAIRYNDFMIDEYQFGKIFKLVNLDTQSLFLTEQEANEEIETKAEVYNRQFMASIVLYESQSIAPRIEEFKQDYTPYFLNIKNIKQSVRETLRGQLKNISYTSSDTRDQYFSSMCETFTAFLYKIEIARLCNTERRILLTNSFADTFLLGPIEGQNFVNEAGRFEDFFYVPSWQEVFTMMSTSGYPRQTAVFKWLIPFLISRLRILCYARYVACLDQKTDVIFQAIANQKLTVETTIFQKLLNEFQRIPNSRDVDVLAGYVHDKETYFYKLFELSLLSAFNSCFIFMKSELSASGMQRHVVASGTKELKFGEIITELIFSIGQKLPDTNSSSRYIPEWQNEFAYKFADEDKQELSKQLITTETYIEKSLAQIKNQSFLDSFQMVQPMTSFIEKCISLDFIKYAFFQVISHSDFRKITKMSAVTDLTQEHYLNGDSIWNDVIIKEALKKITLKGDPIPKKITPNIAVRFIKATIEIVLDHFETAINEQQARILQHQSEEILTGLRVERKTLDELRPETFMFTLKQYDKESFLILPKEANEQFQEEAAFSRAAILTFLGDIIDKYNKDKTKEAHKKKGTVLVLDEGKVKEACASLSDLISMFLNSSLHDEVITWKQYNLTLIKQMNIKIKREESLECIEKFNRERNKRETEAKIGSTYKNEIFKVNNLQDKLTTIKKGMTETNLKIENSLRVGYDVLVKDFKKRINEEKNTFIVRRKMIYKMIIDILKKGHTLDRESNEEHLLSNSDDKEILDRAEKENKEMKKKIKLLRIIRIFSDIAMKKAFHRKMINAEGDRKSVNASLWSNRLMYEKHGAEMEEQLKQAQDRLAESESQLELVKHNLEIEKSANINMVQWKATNGNRIDILKKEIDKVRASKDSPNIYKLLKKIEKEQDELDALIEETDKLDTIKVNEIDKTVKKSQRVRTAINKSRQQSLFTMENSFSRTEEGDYDIELVQKYNQYSAENEFLKNKNIQLRKEIEKYTECIKKYPPKTIKMMEKTAALSRPKTTIIRPTQSRIMAKSCMSRAEIAKKKSKISIFI